MSRPRQILIAAFVLIVTLGIGFTWGASGRFEIQNTLDDIRQQLDLAQARSEILEARVSLYNVNFGEAGRHFEQARAPLRRARQRYQDLGNNPAAGSISAAIAHVEEAQRLAGALDQAANAKANEALEAIRVATSQ